MELIKMDEHANRDLSDCKQNAGINPAATHLLFFFVTVIIVPFFFLSCGKSRPEVQPNSQVGLVFDVGGRGDKSFNDAAYSGLQMAKDSLGVNFQYIEPSGGSDRESALRQLASQKSIGLIFGVGFIFTDDITNVAKDFPDKKFACIDYSYDPNKPLPPNLDRDRIQRRRRLVSCRSVSRNDDEDKYYRFRRWNGISADQKISSWL